MSAEDVASLSLLEASSEDGFRASIISTYSCYFPFYEEVLLRRLVAAGCTHNVLFVDAGRCAEALDSNELRPRRAGRDYTLIPVRAGGAFHPKIVLRIGKSKGALFVGSHNVTLSGFGLNDEVTNVFTAEAGSARAQAGPLRAALEYLAGFVPPNLPEVHDAFEAVRSGVPWLDGKSVPVDKDRRLLTVASTGPDLWSQLRPLVPAGLKRVFVCGPYFDVGLTFVRRLLADTSARELIVGLDPNSVSVDPADTKLPGVRFVSAAGLPSVPNRAEGSVPVVHAKILWFEGAESELLVTGSADSTGAAFLAEHPRRNAEAVVADLRPGAEAELGLRDLLKAARPVTTTEWDAVTTRRAREVERNSEAERHAAAPALLATPTAEGFLAERELPVGLLLEGIDAGGRVLGAAKALGAFAIEADELVRDEAVFLRSSDPVAPRVFVVHRTEEVAKHFGSDNRKSLQHALGALDEDPAQLETLLKLAEKVIFDTEDVVRMTPLRGAAERPVVDGPASQGPDTLALDAKGRGVPHPRRRLASGDLVVLLDALSRRLGEGLASASSGAGALLREAPPDAEEGDQDGGELALAIMDHEALARACQTKVRRLIKKMVGQLEAADRDEHPKRCVVQLAAVLNLLLSLRMYERRPEWRRQHLELVPRHEEWELLRDASLALCWGPKGLLSRAMADADGAFDEASMVVGLLAWVAWDVEVDVAVSFREEGQQGVEDDSWQDGQYFALLSPWLSTDLHAQALLERGIERTPRPRNAGARWLELHRQLAQVVHETQAAPEGRGEMGRRLRPGDLVILSERSSPRVRVALDVEPQTRDVLVLVIDPEADDGVKKFSSTRVASLPWRAAKKSGA